MTAASLITLRETLEASLVVGIVLAYLNVTGNERHSITVWLGVLLGVVCSLLLAIVFRIAFGGFTGTAEALYEGTVMLIGAGLMTWMIWWMFRQRHSIKQQIERDVKVHLERGYILGIFFLVFLSVVREGVETVIFLQAALVHAGSVWQMFGGFAGIGIAILFTVLLFKGCAFISLQKIFSITNILLIFFAAGLVAHGVHELQEAGVIPIIIEHMWDTNAFLNEKGAVGSMFKGVFGYNGNPSLIEVLSYLLYFFCIVPLWYYERRRSAQKV